MSRYQHMLSLLHKVQGTSEHAHARDVLAFLMGDEGTSDAQRGEALTHLYEEALTHESARRVGAALVELGELGEGGAVYELGDEREVVLGRDAELQFDDEYLSPQHISLSWREGKLLVKDLDSINGSFVRVLDLLDLRSGDVFLAGRQVLKFMVEVETVPESDGTRLMGSPSPEKPRASVSQIGPRGEVYSLQHLSEQGIEIGRSPSTEDEQLARFAFEDDRFQSERHLRIMRKKGRWVLEDLGSSNGTWIRIDEERELHHGDFLFVGALLFRVEIHGGRS